MKVDLDGLTASINECIKGPRAREMRFMVMEMARTIRELEANAIGLEQEITGLEQENARLRRDYDGLERKVLHGCIDANCAECDHA